MNELTKMIKLKKQKVFAVIFALMITSSFPVVAQMVTTYEGEMGHTVAFDVASFTDVRDKTLADVLKKMPGVSNDYNISYNGMNVSKIYVNGNNLRSSFSMVAGIKPEEVEKVEFIENIQAVNVLRGKQYSANAAMNIVMKEGAKSDWSGTIKGGSGWSPMLYDADLYAIRIGEKSQSMFNFKANSTGLDLSNSISSFSADDIGITVDYFSPSNYISISESSSPLSSERTRLNDSYMFNTVNTFKLSDNYQLFTQMSYLHDKNESEMSNETTHYFNDGSYVLETMNEFSTREDNQLKANVALISNTDKYYLVNHIYALLTVQDIGMDITGTYPNKQTGNLNSIRAKDDFRFLKPIGDWMLTVFSQNQITAIPQDVTVNRGGTSQYQDIKSRSLFSDTKVSFGYTAGNWTVSLVGGFDALGRTLNTELTGVDDLVIENNDSKFGYVKAYVQPTANYVSEKLQFQVGLPFKYYHYWFDDNFAADVSNKDISNFEPNFELKYNVNSLLSLTLNGEIENDEVDAGSFYTGMILTNYRNIHQGALKYELDGEKDLGFGYSFRLPQYSLFIDGQIGYQNGKSRYRTFDTFVGDYLLRGYRPQETKTEGYSGHININKGIAFLKGSVGVWIGYTDNDRTMIRNDREVDFRTQVFAITPTIKGRLAKWMTVDYIFDMWNTMMTISNSDTKTHSDRYNQSLEFVITPNDKLNFGLLGEHYHTSISEGNAKNLFLADFKAEYQFTDRWQAIVSVTNLLDQRDYSYTSISDLTSSYYSYRIRPRNFLLSLYYKF